MKVEEFYTNLGRLLYAIAMVDGKVHDEELEALNKLVLNELSEELILGKDQANVFYTEYEFEELLDKKANRDDAFNSFLIYLDENYEDFTDEIKELTLMAVEKIANSFEGISDEDQLIIQELKSRLKLYSPN